MRHDRQPGQRDHEAQLHPVPLIRTAPHQRHSRRSSKPTPERKTHVTRGGVTRVRMARTEPSTHAARPPPSLGCRNLLTRSWCGTDRWLSWDALAAPSHAPQPAGRVPRRSGAEIRGPSARLRRLAAGRACSPARPRRLGMTQTCRSLRLGSGRACRPAPLLNVLRDCCCHVGYRNLKYSSRSSCSWRVPRRCRAPSSRPCGRCSPRTGCRSPSTSLPIRGE